MLLRTAILLSGMLSCPAMALAFPKITGYQDPDAGIPYRIVVAAVLACATAAVFWILSRLFRVFLKRLVS